MLYSMLRYAVNCFDFGWFLDQLFVVIFSAYEIKITFGYELTNKIIRQFFEHTGFVRLKLFWLLF